MNTKTLRFTAIAVASLVLVANAAGAVTVKLFDRYSPYRTDGQTSPLAAYNPNVNNYLVVGIEAYDLKSRRTGLRSGGKGPWMLPPQFVSWRAYYDLDFLSFNSSNNKYLLATRDKRYLLNRRGKRLNAKYTSSLALTEIIGSKRWMTVGRGYDYEDEETFYYASAIGSDGKTIDSLALDSFTAGEAPYYLQLGYDSEMNEFLLVWAEKDIGSHPVSETRTIYAQRFDMDGLLVGPRLEIDRNAKEASSPHPVYNPERGEFFIVWKQRNRVMGAFLNGDELSTPFRINGRWRAGMVPSVAYSSPKDKYLVTWVEGRDATGVGIYGRWVNVDGTLDGNYFTVNDKAGDQWVYRPGYSACGNEGACLVTWINDGEGGTIRGQFLRVP